MFTAYILIGLFLVGVIPLPTEGYSEYYFPYFTCPAYRPHKLYGKCYHSYQLPKPASDSPAPIPLGHTFISAGKGTSFDRYYGEHVAALRIKPHIYHAIVEFQLLDLSCRGKADAFLAEGKKSNKVNYNVLLMQYGQTGIKLVDLVNRTDVFQLNLFNSTFGKNTLLHKDCKTKVVRILDLRRFSLSEPFPTHSRYLLFGNGKHHFLSRIPVSCYDFQQILEIHTFRIPPWLAQHLNLKEGLVLYLLNVPGKPSTTGSPPQVVNSVTGKFYYGKEMERDEITRMHHRIPLSIIRKISFLKSPMNLGCPSTTFLPQT